MIFLLFLAVAAIIAIIYVAQSFSKIDWKKFILSQIKPQKHPTTTKPTPDPKTKPKNGSSQPQPPPQPIQSKTKQPVKHISGYYRVLNSDVPMHTITSNFKSEADCEKFCTLNQFCQWYNYNTKTKQCNLNNLKPLVGVNTGMIRKNKTFKIFKNQQINGDIIIKPFMLNKEKLCMNQCKGHGGCHWYTYDTKNKMCQLMKAKYDPDYVHAHKP